MRSVVTFLLFSSVMAAYVCGQAVENGPSWQMYRGDAGRSSYVKTSLNAALFSQAWSVPITFPQSGTGSWYEQGVTSDGTRAFITALEGYAPSGNYHVMAFNLSNGTEAWRRTIAGIAFEGVSSPSYMNGTVYVNRAGHSGVSGGGYAYLPKLIGIDNVTGAVKWETPYSAQWGENFRPIPIGSQVFAAGGYYGGFYGYNAATGGQQWFNSSAVWDPPNVAVAVDDQYVYIDNLLYSRSNGAAAGTFSHPNGAFMFSPIVAGAERYFATHISSAYGFAAFDGATRQLLWERPTAGVVRSAAVGDDTIAVMVDNSVMLLNRDTGIPGLTWNAPSTLWTDLVLTDTHAFVTSGSEVYAISLTTGLTVWNAPYGGELALSNGLLLVSNRDHLTAFRVPEPGSAGLLIVLLGNVCLRRRSVDPRQLI